MVTATLLLAGCSATDDSDSTDPAPAPEETTASVDDEAVDAEERATVNLGLITGAPSLSAANLADAADAGTTANDYEILVTSTPDEIVSKLVNGELVAATVPTNLAANLYNRTEGGVQLGAILSLGFIQVVSADESIQTIDDLAGVTMAGSGKGAVPEYTLNSVLEEHGLVPGEDLTVDYYPGHDEVTTLFITGEVETASLPAMGLVNVMKERDDLHVVFDLTEEWNALHPEIIYSQSALVLSRDFIENDPDAAAALMNDFQESAEKVQADPETTAANAGAYDIMPEPMAQASIPGTNQVFIAGEEAAEGLTPFLQMLFHANPESIGGAVPADDFYYLAP